MCAYVYICQDSGLARKFVSSCQLLCRRINVQARLASEIEGNATSGRPNNIQERLRCHRHHCVVLMGDGDGAEPLIRTEDPLLRVCWSDVPFERWCGFGVAVLFFLFDVFARLLPSAITTTLQTEFALNASEVSSAFGSSVFIAYACTQLVHGILLDMVGPRRLLAVCAIISAVGNLMFAISSRDNVALAVIGRALTGTGIGCAWLGLFNVITLTFVPHQQGVILGAALAIGFLGGMVCNAPFLALVNAIGWRHAVALMTVLPAACAVGFYTCISDLSLHARPRSDGPVQGDDAAVPKRSSDDPAKVLETSGNTASQVSLRAACTSAAAEFKVVSRSYKIYLFALMLGGIDAPLETLAGLWGVTFLEQTQGLSAAQASLAASLLIVVVAVCITAAGFMNNRLPSHHARTKITAFFVAVGVVGMLPMVVQRRLPVPLLIGGLLLLGLGQSAVTFGWVLLAEEGLGSGVATGVGNTIAISCSAVAETAVGSILDHIEQSDEKGGGRLRQRCATRCTPSAVRSAS